jgi:murein DD-endopeptidase MepM/ murein hydrolase activator NlpD
LLVRRRWFPAVATGLAFAVLSTAATAQDTPRDVTHARLGAPDLSLRRVSFLPAKAAPGDSIRVTYSLKNSGRTRAGATVTRIFLSRDRRRDSRDVRLPGKDAVGRVGVNRMSRGRLRSSVPLTLPPGRYRVIACADTSRRLRERREGNNCRSSAKRLVVALAPDRRSALIGRAGGLVALPHVAAIGFAPGALGRETRVDLSAVRDRSIAPLFDGARSFFSAAGTPPYEVRVAVGTAQPQSDAVLVLDVPADVRAGVPPGSEIRVLLLNVWQDETERLESFELTQERFPADAETVTVRVPSYFFTDADQRTGRFRITAVLMSTPTAPAGPPQAARTKSSVTPQRAGACGGTSLAPPLAGELEVRSKFGPRKDPLTGVKSYHHGVDYKAGLGTPVMAAADGTVKAVYSNMSGYGHRIEIAHTGGGITSYSHLANGFAEEAKVGADVRQGDVIAKSGNTGSRSTGPHLHFEYSPPGKLHDRDGKIDPTPCLDPTVPGSITVRDNGALQDDSFEIRINGDFKCRTSPGGSNTCAISGLRSKQTIDLAITVTEAPDDEGTYEIVLSDGLLFDTGSSEESDTLPQGVTVNYEVRVP